MDAPPSKKAKIRKAFNDKDRSSQNKTLKEMKKVVFDLFAANRMNPSNSLSFLRRVEEELGHELKEELGFRDAVEAQYKRLDQPKKRALVSHLTHSSEGELNYSILQYLPFLKERSENMIEYPTRKERSDKIDLSFITEFMHDYCRVNTFGSKVKVGIDERGEVVEHAVHEYHDTLKNIYLGEFKQSDDFEEYCGRTGNTDISFSKFTEGALACPCIQEPTMRVCVDEIETGFCELVHVMKEVLRRNRNERKSCCNFCRHETIRKAELGADYIHPLASPVSLLNHLQCEKVNFPCMKQNGVSLVNSSIFRKDCSHENCDHCRCFAASKECVFSCPAIFDENICYRWKEYMEHTLDNGHSITELRPVASDVEGFKTKFLKSLTQYKKHYFTYRWLNLCRKVDVLNIDSSTIYIQTDYSAQPVLDSQDKLNSQGHGVCVLSCWLVLHSPRSMYYLNKDGVQVCYTYYECDHIRVVSPATGKGKDQDWFLHCKIFEKLIVHYLKTSVPNLTKCVIWTDGAPNQYKCRQNFYWLAKAFDSYNITIIHRFGATAQFKGVHDKIGQVAKWIVKGREKLGTVRVSTAYEFFQAVKEHLIFQEKAYLNKAKPPFEATNYILYYFAADNIDAVGKNCDFVLDRSEMWDNTQVSGCSSAYEFVGLPECKLNMRMLPCPCLACGDWNYDQCSNRTIVSAFKEIKVSEVVTNSPEYLQLPLETNKLYTARLLKAFLKRHNKRVPGSLKKCDLIRLITLELNEYLIPAAVAVIVAPSLNE